MELIKRLQAKKDEQSGFTLIELLIVIIILGILAAIVVFAVGGITDRGTNSACKADYKSVEVAQEAYNAQAKPADYADNVGQLVPTYLKDAPKSSAYEISTSDSGVVLVHVPTVAADATGGDQGDCPS